MNDNFKRRAELARQIGFFSIEAIDTLPLTDDGKAMVCALIAANIGCRNYMRVKGKAAAAMEAALTDGVVLGEIESAVHSSVCRVFNEMKAGTVVVGSSDSNTQAPQPESFGETL